MAAQANEETKSGSESIIDSRPDLYLALVCAAGTDLAEVKQQIKAQLAVVNYRCEHLKVSAHISTVLGIAASDDYFDNTVALMGGGDILRQNSKDGDGVASLIVTAIRSKRPDNDRSSATAFLIDSLKNPKEVDVLDQIYARNFYTISVYSPLNIRRENLANKIARSRHEPIDNHHWAQADKLISKDEKGFGDTGQSVRDTFPKADFFIDTELDISGQIRRFIELVFGEPFTTPTIDEYMMFVAKATALRSCDLSRQVGAVIADKDGSIVATGCNEVPIPKGGFFYEGRIDSIDDNRDKVEQHDPNFHEIKRSISELIDVMKSAGIIDSPSSSSELAESLIHGEHKDLTSEARIRNLIEFGRVVHAEMHAITQAAMLGRSINGSVLYCTTYPCHICARHIISAGISEVVYIEPYPKSLTANLYHREIAAESEGDDTIENDKRVIFRTFRGISPTLYQRVFGFRRRKDTYGAITEWSPDSAEPVGAASGVARRQFEQFVASGLETVLTKIHKIETSSQGESADDGERSERTTSEGQG